MEFWTEATDNETLWTVQTQEWANWPREPSSTTGASISQMIETVENSVVSGSNATIDSLWNSSMSDNGELFQFTFENCLFILLTSLMSLTTVLANVILIILVCVDARLRRYSNYYIISLACADLIVGAFVIPMFSLYTILGRWPLGSFVCELWIIVDFTCVSASVFSISMISLDRYWAITQPLKHIQRQRRKRALLIVCGIWILAVLCWTPAIVANRFILGSFAVDSACLYLPGFIYVLLSNTIIFFLPMVSMVCLYTKLLYALKKHLRGLTEVTEMESPDPVYARTFCCCRETMNPESTVADNMPTALSVSTISFLVDPSSNLDRNTGEARSSRSSSEMLGPVPKLESTSYHPSKDESKSHQVKSAEGVAPSPHVLQETHLTRPTLKYTKDTYSGDLKAERIHQHHLAKHRLHQRTARTLGIIVVAFLMCWLLFVILFPINSYCNCIPLWLYDMSYWLAYLNSTLNPFLYGFSKDFRKAFRRLICPSKKSQNNSMSN